MDISDIPAAASALAAQNIGTAVGTAVLKKAIDSQAAGAAALINALPAPPVPNLPSHLGQNINTTA